MTISLEYLDADAHRVVERLQREGFTTYLVGGCVRDMLLGRAPKDFDIATEARPEELKEVFGRRCRVIGRRFRLAQVRCGPKLLEVATFRGAPDDQETGDDDSGFVVRANTYGSSEEDARSRDFTMNGLFYDPVAGDVIDFIDGRRDIEQRTLRTIGEPAQRFREDPVRILRAIKFAVRLDFELDDALVAAAAETAELLLNCPTARVSEELFRIAESGYLAQAVPLLDELGVLEALLPELDMERADAIDLEAWLGEVDRLAQAHGTLPRDSVFALGVWPAVWNAIEALDEPAGTDWGDLVDAVVEPIAMRLTVPVRCRQRLRSAASILRRQLHPKRRGGRIPRSLARSPSLPVALTILRLQHRLGIDSGEEAVPLATAYEIWAEAAIAAGSTTAPFEPRRDDSDESPSGGRRPRRRSRAAAEA